MTDPIVVDDGHVAVPTAPGLGFDIDTEFLDGYLAGDPGS